MNNAEPLAWFKSSHSGAEGGDCVEVAPGTGTVHVRDSKTTGGPVIRTSRDAWATFIEKSVGEL